MAVVFRRLLWANSRLSNLFSDSTTSAVPNLCELAGRYDRTNVIGNGIVYAGSELEPMCWRDLEIVANTFGKHFSIVILQAKVY